MDRGRHVYAEHLGGLEVDDQVECGGQQHGQFRRLGAVENAPGVNADLMIGANGARRIADQTSSRDKFAIRVDSGQRMARGQRDEHLTFANKDGTTGYEYGASPRLCELGKRGLKFRFGCRFHNYDLSAKCTTS